MSRKTSKQSDIPFPAWRKLSWTVDDIQWHRHPYHTACLVCVQFDTVLLVHEPGHPKPVRYFHGWADPAVTYCRPCHKRLPRQTFPDDVERHVGVGLFLTEGSGARESESKQELGERWEEAPEQIWCPTCFARLWEASERFLDDLDEQRSPYQDS